MNKEKRKKLKELNLQIKLMQQENIKTFQEFSPAKKNVPFSKMNTLLILLGLGSVCLVAFFVMFFIL